MILKQLRISRHLTQEQLADMSGLNVRTIQRIESGHNASLESLKCLASVLEVDLSTLKQETFTVDKSTDLWKSHPLWLKWWFAFNYFSSRPSRKATINVIVLSHITGFLTCAYGYFNPPFVIVGLACFLCAYTYQLLAWQGDKYGVWYDPDEPEIPRNRQ